MKCQIEDFREAIFEDWEPMVTGETGRETVELFTAVYRSKRDHKWIKFPLAADIDRRDKDGREMKK